MELQEWLNSLSEKEMRGERGLSDDNEGYQCLTCGCKEHYKGE